MRSDINLGYLGGVSDNHYAALKQHFASIGKEIHRFEEYSNKEYYEKAFKAHPFKLWQAWYRISNKMFGVSDEQYRSKILDFVDKGGINCVLSYWGLIPAKDIIALKKARPQTRVILNILCHPMGLTSAKITFQNTYFKYLTKYLDGVIYSSDAMKKYFDKNILTGDTMPGIVLSPLISVDDFSDKMHDPCPNQPNIVFLGRTDWWDAQPSDNMRDIFNSILQSKIHLYHCDQGEKFQPSEYRHLFPPMKMPVLKNFATQFDVSLMMYNLDACKRDDRYRITIPDRLISSVAAGIPVAIPREGYEACKDYLKEYKAVLEFDTVHDLKEQLNDRKNIDELKRTARENNRKYIDGSHVNELYDFIKRVMENKD